MFNKTCFFFFHVIFVTKPLNFISQILSKHNIVMFMSVKCKIYTKYARIMKIPNSSLYVFNCASGVLYNSISNEKPLFYSNSYFLV